MIDLFLLATETVTSVSSPEIAGAGAVAALSAEVIRRKFKAATANREKVRNQAALEQAQFEKAHPVTFDPRQRARATFQRYETLCKKAGVKP